MLTSYLQIELYNSVDKTPMVELCKYNRLVIGTEVKGMLEMIDFMNSGQEGCLEKGSYKIERSASGCYVIYHKDCMREHIFIDAQEAKLINDFLNGDWRPEDKN